MIALDEVCDSQKEGIGTAMCHTAILLSFYWNFISCTRIWSGLFSPAS